MTTTLRHWLKFNAVGIIGVVVQLLVLAILKTALGMNYLVIPLSRVGLRPFSFRLFLPAFIGHAFLVGLPLALIARWSARRVAP